MRDQPIEADDKCTCRGFSVSCATAEDAKRVLEELAQANVATTDFLIGTICVAGRKVLGYIQLYTRNALEAFKKLLRKLEKSIGRITARTTCEPCARVKEHFGLNESSSVPKAA